mmetsp:Transcript_2324/g.15471  ORF Transcript_2324/g.15471 Transcript_2324/m.15471 type:complete len:211 (+) Transcript_2324:898-1530(+)
MGTGERLDRTVVLTRIRQRRITAVEEGLRYLLHPPWQPTSNCARVHVGTPEMVHKHDGGHGGVARCPLLHAVRLSKRSSVRARVTLFRRISCHGKNVGVRMHGSAYCMPRLVQAVDSCCVRHSGANRSVVWSSSYVDFAFETGTDVRLSSEWEGPLGPACTCFSFTSLPIGGWCTTFRLCIWLFSWHLCTPCGVQWFPMQASRAFHHPSL